MKFLLVLLAKGGLFKLLLSGGSMLVAMAVYAYSFGWPYAVGFVLLILVHELGHFIAARQSGLAVGAPVFIPFVGAWVSLRDTAMQPATEAHVALAGPMLGSIAAFACYFLGVSGHGHLWMALAQAGFLLNLINLLPIAPLDGGRLAGAISPRLWFIGAPLLLALFWFRPSPMLVLLAAMSIGPMWSAWKGELNDRPTLSPRDRVVYGIQYLGLAAALAVMAFDAHEWLNGAA